MASVLSERANRSIAPAEWYSRQHFLQYKRMRFDLFVDEAAPDPAHAVAHRNRSSSS
jgi:hypothetical protein